MREVYINFDRYDTPARCNRRGGKMESRSTRAHSSDDSGFCNGGLYYSAVTAR